MAGAILSGGTGLPVKVPDLASDARESGVCVALRNVGSQATDIGIDTSIDDRSNPALTSLAPPSIGMNIPCGNTLVVATTLAFDMAYLSRINLSDGACLA